MPQLANADINSTSSLIAAAISRLRFSAGEKEFKTSGCLTKTPSSTGISGVITR